MAIFRGFNFVTISVDAAACRQTSFDWATFHPDRFVGGVTPRTLANG
jgi:hypothetical protein